MKPLNENDMRKLMESVVSKVLPDILRTRVNNIRVGTVISANNSSNTVSVSTRGGNLNGIKFQKGAGTVVKGDQCLLISDDPQFKGQIKAIIF